MMPMRSSGYRAMGIASFSNSFVENWADAEGGGAPEVAGAPDAGAVVAAGGAGAGAGAAAGVLVVVVVDDALDWTVAYIVGGVAAGGGACAACSLGYSAQPATSAARLLSTNFINGAFICLMVVPALKIEADRQNDGWIGPAQVEHIRGKIDLSIGNPYQESTLDIQVGFVGLCALNHESGPQPIPGRIGEFRPCVEEVPRGITRIKYILALTGQHEAFIT